MQRTHTYTNAHPLRTLFAMHFRPASVQNTGPCWLPRPSSEPKWDHRCPWERRRRRGGAACATVCHQQQHQAVKKNEWGGVGKSGSTTRRCGFTAHKKTHTSFESNMHTRCTTRHVSPGFSTTQVMLNRILYTQLEVHVTFKTKGGIIHPPTYACIQLSTMTTLSIIRHPKQLLQPHSTGPPAYLLAVRRGRPCVVLSWDVHARHNVRLSIKELLCCLVAALLHTSKLCISPPVQVIDFGDKRVVFEFDK